MADPSRGYSRLELELRQAIAESLGRAGERLERAVTRYRSLQTTIGESSDPADRERLERAWADVVRTREFLIIQREGIGLRRHDAVDEQYRVPIRARH